MEQPSSDDPVGTFVRNHLGVLPIPDDSFASETDWALVIKLHAYVEATLNHLITHKLGDPRLGDIIASLDTGHAKIGKVAFTKALDLLPSEHRSFIRKFSEIRNQFVHNAKNLDINLKDYLLGLDPKRQKEIRDSMLSVLSHFTNRQSEETLRVMVNDSPRAALWFATIAVMMHSYDEIQPGSFLPAALLGQKKSIPNPR